MLDSFFKVTKFIPYQCVHTVYEIDFDKLYSEGKRFILFDLDNTLIPYDVSFADDKIKYLFNKLTKIGFKFMVVSNNRSDRIKTFCNDVNIKCVTSAKKPFKKGFKKAMKMLGVKDKKEVITIGDQLMTDVLGSNRTGLDCILVHPIKKSSEKWYTKFNRISERNALKRIKKYDINAYKLLEEKHEY